MKLQGLGRYKNLHDLILSKINSFGNNPTEFSALFTLMFSEEENVIAESLVGYKIAQITYGQSKKNALALGAQLEKALSKYPKNTFVGLSMANSLRWIEMFWGVLLAGYKPLLVNSRLPQKALEDVIARYNVQAVISDSLTFDSCQTIQESDLVAQPTDRTEDTFSFGTEVVFMSSGTQGEVKLCAYTAQNFYYQICDTYHIVKDCPQISKGYHGHIKQLALLPFYHVFGFMAVYLWFGFFSRTFVFLKDLSPQTLLNTVRRHKVTHIFAVPMVWDTIYKTAIGTIQSKGDKVVKRFNKGLRLAQKGKLGKLLTHKAFAEVRDQIFGDSVQFMISGGSSVSAKTFEFLNAIGYHIANGYGMTEVGITSVELSLSDKKRNTLSIGKPFKHAQYKCVDGQLYVKSDTRATRILHNGQEIITNFDEWFNTGDLAVATQDGYFIDGRQDDLIISETGENVNPNLVEDAFLVNGVNEVCLFQTAEGTPTLIVSCPKAFTKQFVTKVQSQVEAKLKESRLDKEIRKVVFTTSPLMDANDFKISRKKVATKFANGEYVLISADSFVETETSELAKRIGQLFAKVLQIDESKVGPNDNFFSALGGNSLDYFTLVELIKEETGVSIPVDEAQKLATVSAFEQFIQRRSL